MHLQLVDGLASVERPSDERALRDPVLIPAQGYHHSCVVMPHANLPRISIHPERPRPGPHAERPHNRVLRQRHETGAAEKIRQPVRALLRIANHLRLVVQEKRPPLGAHPHGRVNRPPMNLVHPPEPVLVRVVIKGPAGLHPRMPLAYMPLHRLQRQVKPQRPQILPHMLRHPIISLVDLAHVVFPFIWKMKKVSKAPRSTMSPWTLTPEN